MIVREMPNAVVNINIANATDSRTQAATLRMTVKFKGKFNVTLLSFAFDFLLLLLASTFHRHSFWHIELFVVERTVPS